MTLLINVTTLKVHKAGISCDPRTWGASRDRHGWVEGSTLTQLELDWNSSRRRVKLCHHCFPTWRTLRLEML